MEGGGERQETVCLTLRFTTKRCGKKCARETRPAHQHETVTCALKKYFERELDSFDFI